MPKRSYVEEWQSWGIVTGLQTLLLNMQADGKQTATTADILLIARIYQLEEDLLKRMSYVPDDLEELDYKQLSTEVIHRVTIRRHYEATHRSDQHLCKWI